MMISLLWSLLTTRGCLTGEIIKCPHSPRPSPAQVRRARVAIHQLCNCCHYYLSTIHYLLSAISTSARPFIQKECCTCLVSSPLTVSHAGVFAATAALSGANNNTGGSHDIDTWHVTRGQMMAVPGAAHLSGVLTITSPARGNQPGNGAASLQMWFVSC